MGVTPETRHVGGPGLREQRKESTRRDLIRAGRRLFGERGLYEARIEDLTTDAGIAKGTIYGYFRSKEELILAVEIAGLEELRSWVAERLQAGSSPTDRIETAVVAHFEFLESHRDLVKLFHQVRGMLKFERPEWQALRAGLADYVRALADLLAGPGAEASRGHREAAEILFGAVSGVTSLGIALKREGRPPSESPEIISGIAGLVRGILNQAKAEESG